MIALIPEWKKALKLASVQVSLLLIILESSQYFLQYMPDDVAGVVRGLLLAAIPVVRLMKQNVGSEK